MLVKDSVRMFWQQPAWKWASNSFNDCPSLSLCSSTKILSHIQVWAVHWAKVPHADLVDRCFYICCSCSGLQPKWMLQKPRVRWQRSRSSLPWPHGPFPCHDREKSMLNPSRSKKKKGQKETERDKIGGCMGKKREGTWMCFWNTLLNLWEEKHSSVELTTPK